MTHFRKEPSFYVDKHSDQVWWRLGQKCCLYRVHKQLWTDGRRTDDRRTDDGRWVITITHLVTMWLGELKTWGGGHSCRPSLDTRMIRDWSGFPKQGEVTSLSSQNREKWDRRVDWFFKLNLIKLYKFVFKCWHMFNLHEVSLAMLMYNCFR